nr:UDP-N-acetylglucosamine 2-epimerase (non-hydrolyzing) [uncultured Holophaga sp.]
MAQRILCVMGTRPEVIKMAPVVRALEARGFQAPVLVTAQHRDMLDQMMHTFGLRSTWDLDAMRTDQTLADLTGRLIPALDRILAEAAPDAVLAQGDTATVFCASLAAFYRHIPFGHVEAGLRSGDLRAPFPEEALRRLTAVTTCWHFAPTATARTALLREGCAPDAIHVVGNTVIDSLLETASRPELPWPEGLRPLAPGERLILVTLHRRENFGAPLRQALASIRDFAAAHPEARLVYPVHPNPQVRDEAKRTLDGAPNIHLCAPLAYPVLVNLLRQAFLVFTDSGGLQEEAPALGRPVLVFREVTERPEAVEAGGVTLIGTDAERFRALAETLWNDQDAYAAMSRPRFPYGEGHSGAAIARILKEKLPCG